MNNTSETKYQKKILTIPNVLSFFRICLIPVIVWLYCEEENYLWTTIVLLISGLTDVIDGFIARRFGMISDFGKAFDPIADKLTQAVTLYCLVTRFPFMLLPLIVLVVKEVFAGITGLLRIKKTNKVPMAVWHGKVTTLSLYAMMLIHLIWYNIPTAASHILIGACTAIMLLSAVLYGINNIKVLMEKPESEFR